MSYDKEKYFQDHVNTWKTFVKWSVYGTIGVIAIVVLMAIFLV
ncbi:MAG: aa3-type cytochrome c oxidase subunit IV [Pelagibacterales bacterium]|nr:aa3-type cytochrome c oxidase subunit IV [Pelagibacterales bacterium]